MTECKLVELGGGGVGKTSLVVRFVYNRFVEEYDPTIDDLYCKQLQLDGETVLADVLDSGGREEYSAMREQFMRAGRGFVLCFSITNRKSFDELGTFVQQMHRVKESDNVPMVLVGCKSDLESERQVADSEAHDFARMHGIEYILTSAKDGTNVDLAFTTAIRAVKRWQEENGLSQPSKPSKRGKDAKQFLQRTNCLLQ